MKFTNMTKDQEISYWKQKQNEEAEDETRSRDLLEAEAKCFEKGFAERNVNG
jgi:hypothetical protein